LRSFLGGLRGDPVQAGFGQRFGAPAEGTHSGQYYGRRVTDHRRVGAQASIGPDML
jgi:hypothetical protein